MSGESFLLAPDLNLPPDLAGEAVALEQLLAASPLRVAAAVRHRDRTAHTAENDARALEDYILQQLDSEAAQTV